MSFTTVGSVARPSWRVMNLSGFLTQTARRLPDRPGLVWGERMWTWAEMEARVTALAAGLRGLGLGKGDRVLVHAKNCNAMMEVMFATFRIGAVFVPTNFRLLPDEVIYLAQMSQAKAFVCHADFPAHAAAIPAGATSHILRRVAVNARLIGAPDLALRALVRLIGLSLSDPGRIVRRLARAARRYRP